MLTKIPEKYAKIAADWQTALKASGDEGKKILWNFRNDSRVKTGVRNKFLHNLSEKYKGGDPVAIIPQCVQADMIMQGQEPAGKIPKRFARAVTMQSFIDFHLTRDRLGRPVSKRISSSAPARWTETSVIKAVNDEEILEELKDYIEHKKAGFIWIADAEMVEYLCYKLTCDEVRNHLGLYTDFNRGHVMVIMTFGENLILPRTKDRKRSFLKIPTVMEGKDSCAFTPAEKNEKRSGYLIDLKSGKPTIPEWVCQKVRTGQGFSVLKYSDGDPDKNRLKTEPPNDFLRKYAKMVN